MNYKFTDRVRHALARAREEAIRLQHDYVGTEHLLLGLVREPEGKATAILLRVRVTPEAVRDLVNSSIRPGKKTIALGELTYTSRAKKCLEFAMQSARDLDNDYVGTEHLLLGILREENGIGAQVLNNLGLTYGLGVSILLDKSFIAPAPSEPTTSFRIAIDDASDRSIYEQIIAQVQEGVATGALRAGTRLTPVRQLADELDIAPGTVARAFSELERLGVVVTEGARGTRIAERSDKAGADRLEQLVGLLRPVAVAAFHLGGTADELKTALDRAMTGIYESPSP